MMTSLRPYCIRNAIHEAFIRPAIGTPTGSHLSRRTFTQTCISSQKLSRKQREQSGSTPSPEDEARIRKAQERAAERAAKKNSERLVGNSAQRLLKQIEKQQKQEGQNLHAKEKVGKEKPPEDEEIMEKSIIIDLIDQDMAYKRKVDIRDVLEDMDRETHKLIVVKTNGGAEGSGIPVCRIFRKDYLDGKQKKLLGRTAELAKGEKSSKEMELTWTIGPADLDIKLRQLTRFLEEGRRVDVSLSRKLKWKEPDNSKGELEGLLELMRQTVKGVKGAKEYKEPAGHVGAKYQVYFEGPKGGIKEKAEDAGAEELVEPRIAGVAAS
jgi:translation initiation factor IF-3